MKTFKGFFYVFQGNIETEKVQTLFTHKSINSFDSKTKKKGRKKFSFQVSTRKFFCCLNLFLSPGLIFNYFLNTSCLHYVSDGKLNEKKDILYGISVGLRAFALFAFYMRP